MLIIEGADLTGKTTLAKKLASKLGMIYQHLGPLPDQFKEVDYFRMCHHLYVRDRFHLSEQVYAPHNCRKSKINDLHVLDATLKSMHGVMTVLITCDNELLKDRYHEGEMFTIEQIQHVNTSFLIMNRLADLHFHCTVEKPFVDEEDFDHIVECYLERRKAWALLTNAMKQSF